MKPKWEKTVLLVSLPTYTTNVYKWLNFFFNYCQTWIYSSFFWKIWHLVNNSHFFTNQNIVTTFRNQMNSIWYGLQIDEWCHNMHWSQTCNAHCTVGWKMENFAISKMLQKLNSDHSCPGSTFVFLRRAWEIGAFMEWKLESWHSTKYMVCTKVLASLIELFWMLAHSALTSKPQKIVAKKL